MRRRRRATWWLVLAVVLGHLGCLHEDFPEAHGSLRGAVTAFSQDASPDERRQLAQELESLLRAMSDRPARELRRFVSVELGSRWEPGSREDLAELLELFRAASSGH